MSSLQRLAVLELQLEALMLLAQGGQLLIHFLILAHQSSLHHPHLLAHPFSQQVLDLGGSEGAEGGRGRDRGGGGMEVPGAVGPVMLDCSLNDPPGD